MPATYSDQKFLNKNKHDKYQVSYNFLGRLSYKIGSFGGFFIRWGIEQLTIGRIVRGHRPGIKDDLYSTKKSFFVDLIAITSILIGLPFLVLMPFRWLVTINKPKFTYICNEKGSKKSLPATDTSDTSGTLVITTYNVALSDNFLSNINNLRPVEDRTKEVINDIKNNTSDILCFQEVFSRKAAEELSNSLKDEYPHIIADVLPGANVLNSGLFFASKHEIVGVKIFKYDSKFLNFSANDDSRFLNDDALAAKGALMVVVKLPDGSHQLICNTHLQAQISHKKDRQKQLRQLQEEFSAFKKEWNKNNEEEKINNIFIAGDLNISDGDGDRENWQLTNELSCPENRKFFNYDPIGYSIEVITNESASELDGTRIPLADIDDKKVYIYHYEGKLWYIAPTKCTDSKTDEVCYKYNRYESIYASSINDKDKINIGVNVNDEINTLTLKYGKPYTYNNYKANKNNIYINELIANAASRAGLTQREKPETGNLPDSTWIDQKSNQYASAEAIFKENKFSKHARLDHVIVNPLCPKKEENTAKVESIEILANRSDDIRNFVYIKLAESSNTIKYYRYNIMDESKGINLREFNLPHQDEEFKKSSIEIEVNEEKYKELLTINESKLIKEKLFNMAQGKIHKSKKKHSLHARSNMPRRLLRSMKSDPSDHKGIVVKFNLSKAKAEKKAKKEDTNNLKNFDAKT